jgi:hypothetical protein
VKLIHHLIFDLCSSDYKIAVDAIKEKGFMNVKTEVLKDLVTGWLTKEGEAESVSVDGRSDYRSSYRNS